MNTRFFSLIKKIPALLTGKERRQAIKLIVMVLIMAFFEMLGIASIMPFIAVLTKPSFVYSNQYLRAFFDIFGFSGENIGLFFLGSAVFVFFILSTVFKAITTWRLQQFIHMSTYSLSKRLVYGYLKQPYEWYLSRHSSALGKTVLNEVDQVIGEALMPLMNLIAYGAVAGAIIILLMLVDPLLTLYVGVGLVLAYGAIYMLLHKRLSFWGNERFEANRCRFQIVAEAFGGIKDVKVRGLESYFTHQFDGPAKCYASSKASSQVATHIPRFILEVVAFGGVLLLLLYLVGKSSGLEEALPIITLYAFAGYRLIPSLQQVYVQLASLRFAGQALDNLYNELITLNSYKHPERNLENNLGSVCFDRAIFLENITYAYPENEQPVLFDINLEIPLRTTIGLVGETGSGKTTLVDIILGLLPPRHGFLKVDDLYITKENSLNWQRVIGYVSQSIYLADDSIAANIAFGVPKGQIDFQKVERVSRTANLHEFVIRLPQGYQTKVGERGVRLSGGQRQRIGIARALYHDPQLLILDEATSALDSLTEKVVMEAIHNLRHDITIILIAHRLTTVRECDQIYMLDRGRIVAHGTYDELTLKNDTFRAMTFRDAI